MILRIPSAIIFKKVLKKLHHAKIIQGNRNAYDPSTCLLSLYHSCRK